MQKGFSIILGIIIGLLVIGGGTYFYLDTDKESVDDAERDETSRWDVDERDSSDDTQYARRDSEDEADVTNNIDTPGQTQSASYVAEEDRIKVTSPSGGESFKIGETLNIEWNNYSGNQNLNIGLKITKTNGQAEVKVIANNVLNTGKYDWIVSSEKPEYDYQIEIHPYGDRTRVGRSETFSIIGDGLIKDVNPKSNSVVDASEPFEITGLARNVYNEAEFNVTVSYILDGEEQIITTTIATCSIDGNGCDWPSNAFQAFETTLDLSESPVCGVNVKFSRMAVKDGETEEEFYTSPFMLSNINGCY